LSFSRKWIELEIIMLSELSLSHNDKHHVFYHLWKLGENETSRASQDQESKKGTTKELEGEEEGGMQ
jgi:hypothetical protein